MCNSLFIMNQKFYAFNLKQNINFIIKLIRNVSSQSEKGGLISN